MTTNALRRRLERLEAAAGAGGELVEAEPDWDFLRELLVGIHGPERGAARLEELRREPHRPVRRGPVPEALRDDRAQLADLIAEIRRVAATGTRATRPATER